MVRCRRASLIQLPGAHNCVIEAAPQPGGRRRDAYKPPTLEAGKPGGIIAFANGKMVRETGADMAGASPGTLDILGARNVLLA